MYEQLVARRVERAKTEILADIEKGVVPDSVEYFAELHNFVDANEYGGLCEDSFFDELTNSFDDMSRDDRSVEVANRVQNELDQWIQQRRSDVKDTVHQ